MRPKTLRSPLAERFNYFPRKTNNKNSHMGYSMTLLSPWTNEPKHCHNYYLKNWARTVWNGLFEVPRGSRVKPIFPLNDLTLLLHCLLGTLPPYLVACWALPSLPMGPGWIQRVSGWEGSWIDRQPHHILQETNGKPKVVMDYRYSELELKLKS